MKLNVKEKEKVMQLINDVEKNAKTRLFGGYDRIEKAIKETEKLLTFLGVVKNRWNDTTIHFNPEKVAKSYKYRAEGTAMIIRRFSSGWFVVWINRTNCQKTAFGMEKSEYMILTEKAKYSIKNEFNL